MTHGGSTPRSTTVVAALEGAASGASDVNDGASYTATVSFVSAYCCPLTAKAMGASAQPPAGASSGGLAQHAVATASEPEDTAGCSSAGTREFSPKRQ